MEVFRASTPISVLLLRIFFFFFSTADSVCGRGEVIGGDGVGRSYTGLHFFKSISLAERGKSGSWKGRKELSKEG